MLPSPLEQQLEFLRQIDQLKSVRRQSPLLDQSRKENSAEHSWHLAMYALILNEHASGAVNSDRVIRMLLLHDIVEIDVGDYPIHGGSSSQLQAEQGNRPAQQAASGKTRSRPAMGRRADQDAEAEAEQHGEDHRIETVEARIAVQRFGKNGDQCRQGQARHGSR